MFENLKKIRSAPLLKYINEEFKYQLIKEVKSKNSKVIIRDNFLYKCKFYSNV